MSGPRFCATLTAAAVGLTLAVCAFAAPAAARTPRPAPGAWKVVDLFEITAGGALRVTRTGRVRGIRVAPGPGASTGCGTEQVRVAGTFRMRRATRGGETSWIVGRPAPATSDGVKTVRATVVRGGERLTGSVKVIFAYDSRRKGSVELSFEGCTLEFDVRR